MYMKMGNLGLTVFLAPMPKVLGKASAPAGSRHGVALARGCLESHSQCAECGAAAIQHHHYTMQARINNGKDCWGFKYIIYVYPNHGGWQQLL
mmetsp:Transcript_44333/g.76546  ORF Transcript_44333/g.76546 Transcript_44333/m.76546 type:complete len:93 (-) Transcript_44333:64-342(-)